MITPKKSICVLVCSFFSSLMVGDARPYTYVYPVAQGIRDGVRVVYLMCQSAPETLRLCAWDPSTKELHSILPSLCVPAGCKMLPNKTGFSFIDQGLIKVQNFLKRSPKTIELYDPIYNIMTLEWLDDTTCYLSAKERGQFGIFQISVDGIVAHMVKSSEAHYRYPQKVSGHLFFVEEKQGHYRLMVAQYPDGKACKTEAMVVHDEIREDTQCNESLIDPASACVVYDFGQQPIAFLRMESTHEGFFISYPAKLSMDDIVLTCTYCRIRRETNSHDWIVTPLFVCNVPLDLMRMGSPTRLYESILPLLPRHCGSTIWYASQDDVMNPVPTMDIFAYDLLGGLSTKYTSARPGQIFFAPFSWDGRMMYGFSGCDLDMGRVDMPYI